MPGAHRRREQRKPSMTDEKSQAEAIHEAEERKAPTGRVIHHTILLEGKEELARASSALFWSGLAAGISMGLSLLADSLLHAHLPDAPWRPLVSKLGYSVGFLVVILGRQELFTENTLRPILPLLHDRRMHMFMNVLRLWGIVLAANLIGGFAIAAAFVHGHMLDAETRRAIEEIGRSAMSHAGWSAFTRGILAGWLIALVVWLLPFAQSGRIGIIIILTYLVGLGGLTHSIAGSIEVFALAFQGGTTWIDALLGYSVPTILGNVVGGVTLVAAINHAQVVSGEKESKKQPA